MTISLYFLVLPIRSGIFSISADALYAYLRKYKIFGKNTSIGSGKITPKCIDYNVKDVDITYRLSQAEKCIHYKKAFNYR